MEKAAPEKGREGEGGRGELNVKCKAVCYTYRYNIDTAVTKFNTELGINSQQYIIRSFSKRRRIQI
jgi:hypothetical protein